MAGQHKKVRYKGGHIPIVTSHFEHDQPSHSVCEKTRFVQGQKYIDTSDVNVQMEIDEKQAQVSFVATDLQDKIRMSAISPTSFDSDIRPSTSINLPSANFQHSSDTSILNDLEINAKSVSEALDQTMRELCGSLHGMANLTIECTESYSSAIKNTCDSVDSTVKSTYQLLAKAEELTRVMKPIPKLAQQIKDLKRILDLFEIHMQKTVE